MSRPQHTSRIALLDVDPDLAARLSPEEAALARRVVAARVTWLPRGSWDGALSDGGVGAMVLDGLLTLTVPFEGQAGLQLRGGGEVLLAGNPSRPLAGERVAWTVAEPARLALLDASFMAATRRWPGLLLALLQRLAAQEQRLCVQHAIAQQPRVDQRLRGMLWHLAERWGRVTRAGVVLPLALTHESLGQLVGARRPTVSLALSELAEEGLVLRQPDRSWLLTEDPPGPLRPRSTASPPLIGPRLVEENAAPAQPPAVDGQEPGRRLSATVPELAETHQATGLRRAQNGERYAAVHVEAAVIRERARALREKSERTRCEPAGPEQRAHPGPLAAVLSAHRRAGPSAGSHR